MRNFFITLFLALILCKTVQALPECNKTTHWKKWTNCLGTMIYSNRDKYVGEWEDGFKHGQGSMTWSDGQTYVGEFKANYPSGQGTMTYSDGRIYDGQFEFSKREGQGTMTWS